MPFANIGYCLVQLLHSVGDGLVAVVIITEFFYHDDFASFALIFFVAADVLMSPHFCTAADEFAIRFLVTLDSKFSRAEFFEVCH